jgi:hypothetical protein
VRLWRWGLAGLIPLAVAFYLGQSIPLLIVRSQNSPSWLLTVPLQPPQEFTIQFLHSYDRGFVREHYSIGPDLKIFLAEMTLQSFLNGQGFIGGEMTIEKGLGRIRNIHQPTDKISFFFGSIADHQLIIPQGTIRFLTLAESGEILVITAEEKARGLFLWNRLLHWMRKGKNIWG